jgi:carbamoyltransferase
MIILGINGSVSLIKDNRCDINSSTMHDAGAVLIDNGEIVCAFEEERLNRIKHTNKFPILSIKACLERYNIGLEQVDAFAFPRDEDNYNAEMHLYRRKNPSFKAKTAREHIVTYLRQHFDIDIDPGKVFFVKHHLAHAASSYYVSGFDQSLILALDGWGDDFSGGVYEGVENVIRTIDKFSLKDSIGLFYLEITRLLGFDLFDEYKVMGLAPYGNKDRYKAFFDSLYRLKPDGQYELFSDRIAEVGIHLPGRHATAPITQDHKDIAAALQDAIEHIALHIVRHYQLLTSQPYLCLAGGVALNCTMTGKLLYANIFKDVFVQPASSDGGLALGAALFTYYSKVPAAGRQRMTHVFLGNNALEERACIKELNRWKKAITFHKSQDVSLEAARLIANGHVIGWFQGASEFGPRALGNRSILADPRPPENKSLINKKIKNREAFRPFAPSLIEEQLTRFFELPDKYDRYGFMTFILKVKEEYRSRLGAITHVDGTARLHTVSKEINPRYHALISNFGDITGIPVLLNTSFNNNAEPIIDSPRQAVNCFLTTNLDYLIVGDFIIQKTEEYSEDFLLSLYPTFPRFLKLHTRQDDGVPSFEIGNTYNMKRHRVSHNLYQLLGNCNGTKSFEQLLSPYIGDNAVNIEEIIDEIYELWSLRLIDVVPKTRLTMKIK